ncbi:metal ABC transporter substrate-binding protein [Clostridium sp.]|uniref:metal ABC transporter substrate-binding protein n=1 Tax=Clostridium sp. TaxID=1506 RepID=UPI003028857D
MKRPILSMLLSVLLLLPGCAQAPSGSSQEEGLTVLATTYPVYLFARTVAQGVEGVTVERLNTGSVSCLHDYTLSVDDMKKIEGADVIAMNGAGLEDFMDDALAASSAAVIDCSQGVALFENADHIHEEGDGGHDHGHWDPHYWMDPGNAAVMVRNLQEGFALADPDHGDAYARNGEEAAGQLPSFAGDCTQALEGAEGAALITFHDGFHYFAQALGLPLLASIEEEEGSEASAMEINEITQLVKEHQLPVIFTEVNGSDATANAISRETGCQVAQLTMLMDGPEEGDLSTYLEGVRSNVNTIVSFFGGEELDQL